MLTVNQNIVIHQLKVNNMSNSSVLQVGSSGMIKALSNLSNTGGYTEPAPPLEQEMQPLVPLRPPTVFPS